MACVVRVSRAFKPIVQPYSTRFPLRHCDDKSISFTLVSYLLMFYINFILLISLTYSRTSLLEHSQLKLKYT